MSDPKINNVDHVDRLQKKVLANVEQDRNKADDFLEKIISYIDAPPLPLDGEAYSKLMLSVAKLVEAKSKSNEQVLRIFELHGKKKTVADDGNLSPDEINSALEGETVETS